MPGPTLATEAIVLDRRLPTDSFQGFSVLSPEHGVLRVNQRIAKKPTGTTVPLDLFDEVSLLLESPNEGQSWFVKESRLVRRQEGIGQGYERLELACAIGALAVRNPPPPDGRERLFALIRTAVESFATADRPEAVHFKTLYSFARDEGYPVRQQWLASLPTALRAAAEHWLRTPLRELTGPAGLSADESRLRPALEKFLREHTEIILD